LEIEAMSNTVKAVLFDFGGVFTDSPFHVVHAFGEELGVGPDVVTRIVFGSYEHDGDHPWHQLERGEIALETAREQILLLGKERDLHTDIYELFAQDGGQQWRRGPAAAAGGARQVTEAGRLPDRDHYQ
jgi:FMN phosphatase YigB (HAD superfamily)